MFFIDKENVIVFSRKNSKICACLFVLILAVFESFLVTLSLLMSIKVKNQGMKNLVP